MAEEGVNRRLVAVVAADVAGYSRLMGNDEEATLAALRLHRSELIDPKIAEYNGRIANTAGDSLLVEFSSVIEALRCFLDVQRGMADRNAAVPAERQIWFRVGINVCDVMAQDSDLFGDGVNVAARLEELAEAGGISLSRTARDQVRDRMEIALEDLGEVEVKNIARPVRAFRVVQEGIAPVASSRRPRKNRLVIAAVAVLAVVLAGAAFGWWQPWRTPPSDLRGDRLSIVVLPFDNLSPDPEQAYFADAITEDLITDLSRIRNAFVIARSTSFAYKEKSVSAKEIATDLDVRYVLEGSVRRAGNQVRVNAQLIDGDSGAQLWSEKFDRKLADIIALQSDITGHIASVLRAELLEAESRRPKPANLRAWDYAVQGQVKLHNVTAGPRVFPEAKALFEKALSLDPNQALAWEGLAWIHFVAATRELQGISKPNSRNLALEAAQKAVLIDSKSSNAYRVLGLAHFWMGSGQQALDACQKSLDLNPNNDEAYLCLARAKFTLGRLEEANEEIERSKKLNPSLRKWLRHFYRGTNFLYMGKFDEARRELEEAKAGFPKHQLVNMYLAAALAMSGQEEQARKALASYLLLVGNRRNTIEKIRADRAHIVPNFEILAEGLRRAGMPER